jgi:plastocyanin
MTADNGDFATPTNQEACLMFMTAGTWPFHCSVHPFMTGTLTVQ